MIEIEFKTENRETLTAASDVTNGMFTATDMITPTNRDGVYRNTKYLFVKDSGDIYRYGSNGERYMTISHWGGVFFKNYRPVKKLIVED